MPTLNTTELVHRILGPEIQDGDWCVDATAGNGHDTQFLAERVGATGRVLAIDLQATAIQETRRRLVARALDRRCELVVGDHVGLAEMVPDQWVGRVALVMFNLGYLPGGDHGVITDTESTVKAVKAAIKITRLGGIVSIIAYPGHDGGSREAQTLVEFVEGLDGKNFEVIRSETLLTLRPAPFHLAIRRVG